jgi:hypothetical protein
MSDYSKLISWLKARRDEHLAQMFKDNDGGRTGLMFAARAIECEEVINYLEDLVKENKG